MLEKMNAFFESRLATYDEHMLTEISGAKEFYLFTAMQLPTGKNCSILDLGCGTGLELEQYFPLNPNALVTGIDLSASMLEMCKEKFPDKNLRLINGDYFSVSLGKNLYNAAVSVESLHHFTKQKKLLLYRRLCAALTWNGYFILTDYFAESKEKEKEYFEELEQLKTAQNINGEAFYHYDTPLTVEHEIAILKKAGFACVAVLKNWGATYTLKAQK